MVTVLGEWFEMVSRPHPGATRCVSVSLGVGTEPLHQPFHGLWPNGSGQGSCYLVLQQGGGHWQSSGGACTAAGSVCTCACNRENLNLWSFCALTFTQGVTKGAIFRCVRRREWSFKPQVGFKLWAVAGEAPGRWGEGIYPGCQRDGGCRERPVRCQHC